MLHVLSSGGWCFYCSLWWYSPFKLVEFRHYTLKLTKSEHQNLNISLSTTLLCFSTSNHQNCGPSQKTTRVYIYVCPTSHRSPPESPLQLPSTRQTQNQTRSSQAKPIRLTVEKEKVFCKKKKNARKDKESSQKLRLKKCHLLFHFTIISGRGGCIINEHAVHNSASAFLGGEPRGGGPPMARIPGIHGCTGRRL